MRIFTRYLSKLLLLFLLTGTASANSTSTPFMAAFDKHSVVMLLIDPQDGRIVAANKAASDYYGYSQAKLQNLSIQQINTFSPQAVAEERERARQENRNYFIFRHQLADGSLRTVEVSSVPMQLEGRALLFSIVHDISELRAARDSLWHYQNQLEAMVGQQVSSLKSKETFIFSLMAVSIGSLLLAAGTLLFLLIRRRRSAHRLRKERDRLDDIIWGTHAGTWEWQINVGRIHINSRWAEMLGYRHQQLTPLYISRFAELTHKEDLEEAQDKVRRCLSGETDYYEAQLRMRHRKGYWVWFLDRGRVVERDRSGKPVRMCGTRQDITADKEAHLQLEHLALHDQLTGIANRTLFYQQLTEALAADNCQLAMMFIDLDGFKQVNDEHGHHNGDALLIQVAQRLRRSIRHSDLVARMGGDEFSAILYHVQQEDAAAVVAEHILQQLSHPFELEEGLTVQISCSVGVALYPQDARDANALVQKADDAMYVAKESGKNRCVFTTHATQNTAALPGLQPDQQTSDNA